MVSGLLISLNGVHSLISCIHDCEDGGATVGECSNVIHTESVGSCRIIGQGRRNCGVNAQMKKLLALTSKWQPEFLPYSIM